MLSKKIILPSLATLLMMNGCIFATEATENNSEASLADGSSEMNAEKQELKQRLQAAEAAQENQTSPEAPAIVQKANYRPSSTQSQFMFAPTRMEKLEVVKASYSFPLNSHWLTNVSDNGQVLYIEDGSQWIIKSSSDSYTLSRWRREDSIVITPNTSLFYPGDFFITNRSRYNTYVCVDMHMGPTAHGKNSHWIIDLDNSTGHVKLENQTIWTVDPEHRDRLKTWAIDDHIIFGIHQSWFSPFDYMLINANMDNYIYVKQY